jgi:hypothetical protein
VRLEVTSSNFPRYARNQNTGLPLGSSDAIQVADQQIFHDAAHASHLILPVIPREPQTEVPQRPDGSWRLTGDTAQVRGSTLKLFADAGILGNWSSGDDEAEWKINVSAAGTYRAVLNFACAGNSAGNRFELAAGANRLAGTVPATGTWYDQREADFGEIKLDAGQQTIRLRPAAQLHGALFDLRAVTLIRMQ